MPEETKTEVVKDVIIPEGMTPEVFYKAQSELKPSTVRSLSFDTLKQKNAQFIQKGLAKPGRVSFDVLRRAANSVHIARICINVLKEKVTKTKWVIKSIDPLKEAKEDKDDERVEELENLLKHPNKTNETFRTLLDKMLEDLLVLDAVAVEKTRYPDGKIAELHFVDAATIRPVFDEYGNQDIEIPLMAKDGEQKLPVSYVQVMNNSKYGGAVSGEIVAAWPKKDFLYFHMHPQGSMEGFGYGLSPIESVLSVIANLLNADNFNGTYFEEGSFPPVIIQLMGQVNQRDIQAYREYLYSELLGNFHRPAIMAGDKKTEVINLKDSNNRDMQFMEYMKFLSRLLAAAYGLAAQDIGIVEDLNRATSEVQKDLSQDKGYGSILHLLKEVINQEIIWKDFGYTDLEFDWIGEDNIDEKEAAQLYDTYLKNGMMTLNEAREAMGEQPYEEWADEPMILTGTGYVPAKAKPVEPGMIPGQDPGKEFPGKETIPGKEDIVGGEKNYDDQAEEEVTKSIYTNSGYKTFADDRGYGQPFIFVNAVTGKGFVVKPPVAVNLYSQDLEAEITDELGKRGLPVPKVIKTSYVDVVNKVITDIEVLGEFNKYITMSPEYDSEKWRGKHGGSRKYPYYLVQEYVDGYCLTNPLLIADMKRDPDSYKQAIADLAALWQVEKELVLGDRRADQYIITPQKRAFGIDYQFKGDVGRYKDTEQSIFKVLKQNPALYDTFTDLTQKKPEMTIKSLIRKVENTFRGINTLLTSVPTSANPSQDYEKDPVLFGELMRDAMKQAEVKQLFAHQSVGLMTEQGFQEHTFTYDFNQATKALGDWLKKNPEKCGGVITQKDEKGIKYLVFVNE